MRKLLFADLLKNATEMSLTTLNNCHDLPEFVLIELKKKDQLIKSQQILISELQNKLSRYCKHENDIKICDSECNFAK